MNKQLQYSSRDGANNETGRAIQKYLIHHFHIVSDKHYMKYIVWSPHMYRHTNKKIIRPEEYYLMR